MTTCSKLIHFLQTIPIKFPLFLVAVLVLLVGSIPYWISEPKPIDCPATKLAMLSGEHDLISCIQDFSDKIWFVSHIEQSPKIRWNEVMINAEAFPNGVTIENLSVNKNPLNYRIGTGPISSLPPHTSTGDGLNIILKGFYSKEDLQKGLTIFPFPYNVGSTIFHLSAASPLVGQQTQPLRPALQYGEHQYWLVSITVLLAFLMGLASIQYTQSSKKRWGILAICVSFLLAFINFERPYRGMGGYLDKGDDTRHFAFAQNHVKDGNLFVCDADVAFSKMEHVGCHGLPGTGLMLELGIFFDSIINNRPFHGAIDLTRLQYMRMASAFYSFIAMIILFLLFHQIGISALNIVLAAGIIWGTSLSMWTFERSIFTHSIELFLLSLLCLIWITAGIKKQTHHWAYPIFSACVIGLLLNTRAEYMILGYILFPLYLLLEHGVTFQAIRKRIKPTIWYAIFLAPFVFFYIYFLQKTHSEYAKGSGYSILTSMQDLLKMSFYEQYFGNIGLVLGSFWQAGWFLFLAFFTMLLSCAGVFQRSRFIYASLVFSLCYFFALCFFYEPLGAEWQHRYFLKLYPFAFLVILMIYANGPTWYRITTWGVAIASLYKEYIANENTLIGNDVVYFEPFKRFMTDTHLLFHGYQLGYYGDYTLGMTLIFIALVGCLLFQWRDTKRV